MINRCDDSIGIYGFMREIAIFSCVEDSRWHCCSIDLEAFHVDAHPAAKIRKGL